MSVVVVVGWLALGALLGVAFIVFVRVRRYGRERRAFALGLVIAALVYVIAAALRLNGTAVLMEGAALAAFGGVVWSGVRTWGGFIALGWALHVVWDAAPHLWGDQSYIGPWYPILCISFDLVVACYLGWRLPGGRADSSEL